MDDLGLHHQKAHSTDVAALVEILAEDYEAAEREARHAYPVLTEMGDVTYRASEALLLAQALELQGRADESEEWLAIANAIDDTPDDPDALVVRARLLAQRGHLEEATGLARSALDRAVDSGRAIRRRRLYARRDPHSRWALRGSDAGCRGMPSSLRGEGHRPVDPEDERTARRNPGSRLSGERELRQDRQVARLSDPSCCSTVGGLAQSQTLTSPQPAIQLPRAEATVQTPYEVHARRIAADQWGAAATEVETLDVRRARQARS